MINLAGSGRVKFGGGEGGWGGLNTGRVLALKNGFDYCDTGLENMLVELLLTVFAGKKPLLI
jgi:hypothetical protein